MTQSIGTNYLSTIATLSDGASILEAFKYYHTGGLTGSIYPNSIEQRLTDIWGVSSDTTTANILNIKNWTGYNKATFDSLGSIATRISTLESTVGTSLSSTYIKAIPSTNDIPATRNLISPSTSSVIPLTIQGVLGQSADLQQWKTSAATVAKVDSTGKMFSYDGTSTAEVATLSGTQTFTNKTLTTPIQTIGTNARTSSYVLTLSDQSKVIEINSSSATTVGVPLDSSVNFPIGTCIAIMQTGSGQITIDPAVSLGGNVTVNSTPGLKTRTQWSMATLIKRGTNLWVAVGDLSA